MKNIKRVWLVALLGVLAPTAFASQIASAAKPAPVLDEKAPRLLATRLPAKDDARKFLLPETKLDPAVLKKLRLRVVPLEGFTALIDEDVVGEEYALFQAAQVSALAQAYSLNHGVARMGDLPKGAADAIRRGVSSTSPNMNGLMQDPSFEIGVIPFFQVVLKGKSGERYSVCIDNSGGKGEPKLTRPTYEVPKSDGTPSVDVPQSPGSLDEAHLLFQNAGWTRVKRTHAARLLMEWLDDNTQKLQDMANRTSEALRMALWNDNKDVFGDTMPTRGQSFDGLDPTLQRSIEQAYANSLPGDQRTGVEGMLSGCTITALRVVPGVKFNEGLTYNKSLNDWSLNVGAMMIDLVLW